MPIIPFQYASETLCTIGLVFNATILRFKSVSNDLNLNGVAFGCFLFSAFVCATPPAKALTTEAGLARVLKGDLSWVTSAPLKFPIIPEDGAFHLAYKNPAVVKAKSGWHIFASRKCYVAGKVRHSMAYLNLSDWNHPEQAKVVPLFTDEAYTSAPAVFYYTPHQKWYLFYGRKDPAINAEGPAFSTMDDIDRPETITPPVMCFPSVPESLPKKKGVRWLDFTLIGDGKRMYLFFTDDSGHFMRSSTSLDKFPLGWEPPVVVMKQPTSVIFEASCTFRLKNSPLYLTIIEAIEPKTGLRFFTSFVADSLEGEWRLINGDASRPFAGFNNVRSADGTQPWSPHISHGEMLCAIQDESMILDPEDMTFLYQGWNGKNRVPGVPLGNFNGYHEIPWELALIKLDASNPK